MYPNTNLYTDGAWKPAVSGKTLEVLNPATGDPIGTVAHAEKADLDIALAAAQRGFETWRKVSAHERYRLMRKAADILRGRINDVAATMTMEQGKPLAEAKGETMVAVEIIDWFAEEARRSYGRTVPARMDGVYQLEVKEPVGPVAAFTPWNFPINQAVRKISCAVAAGCSIIIKGPEETPAACAALVSAFVEAGLPAGRHQPRIWRPCGNFVLSHPAPGHPQNLVHRVDRGRQAACGACRRAHEARHHGARRPCAGDRVRRMPISTPRQSS